MTSSSPYDPHAPQSAASGQYPAYPTYPDSSGSAGYSPSSATYPSAGSAGAAGYGQAQGQVPPGYQQPYQGGYQAGYADAGAYYPQAAAVPQAAYGQGKSKVAAGLLGIFLGSFGVHNFYLGNTGRAGAQLGLTVGGIFLSFILIGVPMVVAAEIWGVVEGIMILCATPGVPPWGTDARGVPLTS